jgi:hypothetical protein
MPGPNVVLVGEDYSPVLVSVVLVVVTGAEYCEKPDRFTSMGVTAVVPVVTAIMVATAPAAVASPPLMTARREMERRSLVRSREDCGIPNPPDTVRTLAPTALPVLVIFRSFEIRG